jgi:hypothetical protein
VLRTSIPANLHPKLKVVRHFHQYFDFSAYVSPIVN